MLSELDLAPPVNAELLGGAPHHQAIPHDGLDDVAAIQFAQAHCDGVRSCHVVLPPSRAVRHFNLAQVRHDNLPLTLSTPSSNVGTIVRERLSWGNVGRCRWRSILQLSQARNASTALDYVLDTREVFLQRFA